VRLCLEARQLACLILEGDKRAHHTVAVSL
jgi:hypothetical protein